MKNAYSTQGSTCLTPPMSSNNFSAQSGHSKIGFRLQIYNNNSVFLHYYSLYNNGIMKGKFKSRHVQSNP